MALATPFFAQTAYQCGPAALATLLVDAGVDTSPDELVPGVYLPGRRGSLQIELLGATRAHGRIPFVLPAGAGALLAELRAGRPVLVLQNLGTRSVPLWHYAVLTGFDLDRDSFRLNSGMKQGMWLSASQLLRTWEWGGQWAMVALRPGEFPASVSGDDAARYLQAVADFEAVAGDEAAAEAWRSAARRWPGESGPRLALGNHAYAGKHLREAALWYSRGLRLEPGSAVLANNLAAVLGELGCANAGAAVLGPVAATLPDTSTWRAAVDATLHDLQAQAAPDREVCVAILNGHPETN